MGLLDSIKGIFVKSSSRGWFCDYQDDFCSCVDSSVWSAVSKHNGAQWNAYMKGKMPTIMQENGVCFARFPIETDGDEIETVGLWTKGKKMFRKGKMEFKVRFNSGRGTWPAVWLRNISSQDPDNWMDNYYEIDVVEYFARKLYSNQTFHTEASMKKKRNPVRGFSVIKKTEWNIFEVEWDESSVRIFVNGSLALDAKAKKGEKFPDEYYLILSAQYNFEGSKWDKSELPKWMDVQYVRHYSRV